MTLLTGGSLFVYVLFPFEVNKVLHWDVYAMLMLRLWHMRDRMVRNHSVVRHNFWNQSDHKHIVSTNLFNRFIIIRRDDTLGFHPLYDYE